MLRIYDSNNRSLLLEFSTTHGGSDEHYFWQMAFSPDGGRRAFATAQADGAYVWDVATGKQLLSFSGHGEGTRTSGIAFSPDGKWVATVGNDAARPSVGCRQRER